MKKEVRLVNPPTPKYTIDALTRQLNSLVTLMSVIPFNESMPDRYKLMAGGFFDETMDAREKHKRQLMFMSLSRNLLDKYGIHESNKGYAYIIDSLRIILQIGAFDIRLNTDIYPIVAFDFGIDKVSIVEHAIRNAISAAYRDYERDEKNNSMGEFCERPSNKKFLIRIADTICTKISYC